MNEAPANNRRRGAFFLFLMLALVMLVAAIWQYHQMLVSIYDRATEDVYRRLFRRGDAERRQVLMPLRVALFASPDMLALEEQGPHYALLIASWEKYLERERLGFRVVSEIPKDGMAEDFDLLVLPAVSHMTDTQIEGVKQFLRQGKGLLMTWAAGTRDETGNWRRYSLLQVVGGLEFDGSPAGLDEHHAEIMLTARSPITEGLSPGFRLRVHRRDHPVAALAREPRAYSDGRWMKSAAVGDQVGIAHGHYFDGRYVWTGFTIGSGVEAFEHLEAFYTILHNAVIWAGGQPLASKPLWPRDRTGAFSWGQRIESPDDLDDALIQLASRHHVPLNTFLHIDMLDQLSESDWQHLGDAGSVCLMADPVAKEDETARPVSAETLRNARRLASDRLGRNVTGFRTTDGTYDERLLDALPRAGFQYLTATGDDRLAPRIVRSYRPIPLLTRPRELWLIPEQDVHASSSEENLWDMFSHVHAHGGYAVVSVRPSMLADDARDAWDHLLTRVRRERVWIAATDDVAAYGKQWGHIRLATRYISPTVTRLTISNTGRDPVEEFPIQLEMDRSYRRVDFRPTTLGSPPVTPISVDEFRWRVSIPVIRPGKNYSYNVSRYD